MPLTSMGEPVPGYISEANCSTVDYTAKFGGTRYQGKSGTCYAFASAELLGEYLGIAQPDRISAFDVAVLNIAITEQEALRARANVLVESPYQLNEKPLNFCDIHANYGEPLDDRDGGCSSSSISAIMNRGYACLESEVPSEDLKRTPNFFKAKIQQLSAEPEVCRDSKSTGFQIHELKQLHYAVHDWAALKLKTEVEKACRKRIPIPAAEVKTAFFPNATMAENLGFSQNHETPMMYIQRVFKKRRPFSLSFNTCQVMGVCPGGLHEAVVTGRRWNEARKVCEIQMKNSWGHDSYVWVDSNRIDQSSVGVTYIEKMK